MGFHGAAGGTAQALQHIISKRWVNAAQSPIIGGGVVTGRGDLKYGYSEGAAVVATAYGALEVEWAAGQTSLVNTPSAARTDTIYVDSLGQVNVAQGVEPPANTAVLDKMRLGAGATVTSAATHQWNKKFALPYGSTLGWLAMFIETYQQGTWAVQQKIDWVSRTFYVPTDRHVQMQMAQCIFGVNTSNPSSMCFGSFRYGLYVDGSLVRVFELGYDRRQAANLFSTNLEVTAGQHTIKLDRELVWRDDAANQGPQHFGSPNNTWQPGFMGVLDVGVDE